MYQAHEIMTLKADCQITVDLVTRQLIKTGFEVIRSFDLRVARAAHVGCTCPHHGTELCNCQMVVLLIFGGDTSPATLVVHGHDNETNISLVDAPDQRPSAPLEKAILQTVIPEYPWISIDGIGS
jgi:hypothetical protein